jgi:hypothetical protein
LFAPLRDDAERRACNHIAERDNPQLTETDAGEAFDFVKLLPATPRGFRMGLGRSEQWPTGIVCEADGGVFQQHRNVYAQNCSTVKNDQVSRVLDIAVG